MGTVARVGIESQRSLPRRAQAAQVAPNSFAKACGFDLVGRVAAGVECGSALDLDDLVIASRAAARIESPLVS